MMPNHLVFNNDKSVLRILTPSTENATLLGDLERGRGVKDKKSFTQEIICKNGIMFIYKKDNLYLNGIF